jgi:uncharacterized Ntn-hydrolase superfamily protein
MTRRSTMHSRSLFSAVAVVLLLCAVGCVDVFATFSIVAYDSVTNEIGVAVQSKVYNVGVTVPWAKAGVGGVATQALANTSLGPMGLDFLEAGLTAEEAMTKLISSDEGHERRQLGVVDVNGASASFTGKECMDWAGGVTGRGYAIQGNILAGEAVVTEMERVFLSTRGELSRRLVAALAAGQGAGGDTRGQQSAALLVVRPSEEFPEYNTRYVEIKVEDHPEPIEELERLLEKFEGTFLVEAHVRYAEKYEKEGKSDLLKRELELVGITLERVLARQTDDAGVLNALAWHLCTHDVFLEKSLEAARRAVALEPESPEITDTLAEAYWRLGMTEEAISTGEAALALDPESEYLKEQLAKFKAETD